MGTPPRHSGHLHDHRHLPTAATGRSPFREVGCGATPRGFDHGGGRRPHRCRPQLRPRRRPASGDRRHRRVVAGRLRRRSGGRHGTVVRGRSRLADHGRRHRRSRSYPRCPCQDGGRISAGGTAPGRMGRRAGDSSRYRHQCLRVRRHGRGRGCRGRSRSHRPAASRLGHRIARPASRCAIRLLLRGADRPAAGRSHRRGSGATGSGPVQGVARPDRRRRNRQATNRMGTGQGPSKPSPAGTVL